MSTSDVIPGGTVPEYVAQGGVEMTILAFIAVQDQVEWSSPRTMGPSSPILRSTSPETPKVRSPRGDLEPVMANEEEVV